MQLLLSQVSLVRICILTVIPPTDAAFALRFSFAICNKYELYHFQFLKGWQLEVSKSKVFLFCFSVVYLCQMVPFSLYLQDKLLKNKLSYLKFLYLITLQRKIN